MRDIRKNEKYFQEFIRKNEKYVSKRLKETKGRGFTELYTLLYSIVRLLIAKYSFGCSNNSLVKDFTLGLDIMSQCWKGGKLKAKGGTPKGSKVYNYYHLDAYELMLNMLSIGYLFDVSDDKFERLVLFIDKDEIKDYLFDFIISAKMDNRKFFQEEGYVEHFEVPNRYRKLRQVIVEGNKEYAAKLVKSYLEKDWYNDKMPWYSLHKKDYPVYYGYWSFETAAVVQAKGIPDDIFRDNEFYPKDLVTPPSNMQMKLF